MNADYRGRRVAIVGGVPILEERSGRSAYLSAFCRVLRAMGFRVDLLFLNRIGGGRLQLRFHADYLESVDSVAIRDAFRLGAWFISSDPAVWRNTVKTALRRRHPQGFSGNRAPWYMSWPKDEALDWAGRRLSTAAPDVVVANYFNASRVFTRAGPHCLKAVLVHDVFARRKQSYEASGLPLDFDERMIAAEAEAFASADLCLAITPEDAEFIRGQHPGVRTVVLPYVIDISARTRPAPPRRCLFVGSNNEPNRRALAWLLDEVWPRVVHDEPGISLRVVGGVADGMGEGRKQQIEWAGRVDDLASEYSAAAVALVPLRAGSGLKIKLIEALAYGVPVASTTVGAEGVERASPDVLRIHDDPGQFAEAVVALSDPSTWTERSGAAARFAADRYSEAAAQRALAEAFAPIATSPPRVRAQSLL